DTTCQRVAPSPYAAWRRASGTALIASLAGTTITGTTSSDKVRAAAKTTGPSCNARTNTVSPRLPSTMLGTPASLFRLTSMSRGQAQSGAQPYGQTAGP